MEESDRAALISGSLTFCFVTGHHLKKLCVSTTLLLSIFGVRAGTESDEKTVVQPPLISSATSPWEVRVGVPGWVPWLTGTIGLHGVNSNVNVAPSDIIPKLDMIAALSVEVRYARFGVIADSLYLGASDDAGAGGLVSKLDLRLQQYLGDFGATWRFIQGDRGWLDALAGFRYTYLHDELTIHPDDAAIAAASTQAVSNLSQLVSGAASNALQQIVDSIANQLSSLREQNPPLPVPPLGGRLPPLIADQVEVLIESKRASIQAAVEDLAESKRSNIQAAIASAQNQINQLKVQLANQIAFRLQGLLSQTLSRTDDWFDPYIGLRGQYNLTRAFT